MPLLEINWNPSRRELRQFALIWIVFFTVIGGLALARSRSLGVTAVFWAVAAVGLLDLVRPGFLRPVYVIWMCLALPIGWVVSHLLLMAVYYLILTLIGLVTRLFGYGPLNRRFDRSAKSYWTPHDPGSEPARYFKQF